MLCMKHRKMVRVYSKSNTFSPPQFSINFVEKLLILSSVTVLQFHLHLRPHLLPSGFTLLQEFKENSWIFYFENSILVSTPGKLINLVVGLKNTFWDLFFLQEMQKIDVNFPTLGSWIYLFTPLKSNGKLLEFDNLL